MADSEVNVWQELLKTSTGKIASFLSSDFIILGDRRSGKSAILSKIKGRITIPNTPEYILDYSYLNVVNRYALDKEEIVSRMNIWALDDEAHADLLADFVSNLSRTAFAIVLDFSKPWQVLPSLHRWLEVLKTIVEKRFSKLPPEEQNALKLHVSTAVQTYVDPSASKEKSAAPDAPRDMEVALVQAIDPAVPAVNLGVPIVFVAARVDTFAQGVAAAKSAGPGGLQERFDYVTQHLRTAALQYGASIVYTSSVGEGTNIQTLEDLVYHRIFDFPLKTGAKVVGGPEDFALYVPAGYDSKELIATASHGKKNAIPLETPFATVFEDPKGTESKAEDAVVEAIDDEEFFQSLANQLLSGKPDSKPQAAASSAPTDLKKKQKAMRTFFKNLMSESEQRS